MLYKGCCTRIYIKDSHKTVGQITKKIQINGCLNRGALGPLSEDIAFVSKMSCYAFLPTTKKKWRSIPWGILNEKKTTKNDKKTKKSSQTT